MKILITGGAGFVGSSLAKKFKQSNKNYEITVFDNLKRRGSELNLDEFRKQGIDFFHGDIRNISDLKDLSQNYDLMIEASAEPSVKAGLEGNPQYLLDTNLNGTLNCLEFAREHVGTTVFLSTSRVYSIPALVDLPLKELDSRFDPDTSDIRGFSKYGINEDFDVLQYKSLYGATKFASETIIQEYIHSYDMEIVVNRCGVIAGPGQFGKVDQGVFTLWVANHYYKKSLAYTGFGGKGKQVRDLLHPDDLFDLIKKQLNQPKKAVGQAFNVGGGVSGSVSLAELTKICQSTTGNAIEISSKPETNSVDIPYFVCDSRRAQSTFDWQPRKEPQQIVTEIHEWINANSDKLKTIFG